MDEVDGMAGNEDRGGMQVLFLFFFKHAQCYPLKSYPVFFIFFNSFAFAHLSCVQCLQELIGLIKNSKIPIICMCNDRNHPKIRSLSNYCFDLRFQRPRLEQIKVVKHPE